MSFGEGDRSSGLLNAVFVLVALTALAVTVTVIILPKENSGFTNFYILDKDGMTDAYPSDIVAGKKYPVYIGVENHEKRNVTYTIEIWNMKTAFQPEKNTTLIESMDARERFSFALSDNQSTVIPYSLSVDNPENNRIYFLLFNETVPSLSVLSDKGDLLTGRGDRVNASYRNLYLRVSVQPGISAE